MHTTNFKFEQTGYFSSLLKDYVANSKSLNLFLSYEYSWQGIQNATENRNDFVLNRAELPFILFAQYEGFEISTAVSSNIESLSNSQTYCVVTAHQLSLFGGPLYYVIKIANAIRLCKELKTKFPDRDFVPVYWVGSEDHDFEEVNHIHLFGKKIIWNHQQGGAVGRYSTTQIQETLDSVKEILGASVYAAELMDILSQAYQQPTVAKAGRFLVNALFGTYGLVIVDGDDAALKKQMIPVFEQELISKLSFSEVNKQSALLQSAGYHAQAKPREINLFLLSDRKRERIIEENGRFKAGEEVFEQQELLNLLKTHPERFSPNVILRPLYQQTVLPSVAFIGGGGEIAYWMQLKSVFEVYQGFFPVLIPRTSLMITSAAQRKKLDKLGLIYLDIFKETQVLKKEYLLQHAEIQPDFSEEKSKILEIMLYVQQKMEQADKTLGPLAGAEAQKMASILDNLQNRLLKAEKQKQDVSLQQIEQLKLQLFPEGNLQERVDNFMNWYAKSGSEIIKALIECLCPVEQEFVVLDIV